MRLIVGLGNPGPKYQDNRHNVGFMAVDALVRRHSFAPWRARFQAQAAEGAIAGEKCLILKPTTFMNESGRAVGEAARFYKIDAEDIAVFYDELDLAPTKVKVKQGGGAAGHNGLRSLDAHLGKDVGAHYHKIRIGIGHPGDKSKVLRHVLGDFSKAERADVDTLLEAMAEAFPSFIKRGGPDFMTRLALLRNPKPETPQKLAVANTSKPAAPDEPQTALAAALKQARGSTPDGD
ncbi:MAG: aminoacyl-tRNA hydrolase [Alphaproteobacteria bacterium]|nr:aminoacyl-tRNA hydrolase [Alphaproteobacteria bacterium]